MSIEAINPFHCRMWDLHDRMEETINEQTCEEEIKSFAQYGQIVPALGRPLRDDPNHRVELIYGARRLFIARRLNVPLQVQIRNLTDRAALVAMDIENRHRTDLSPYERGLSYAKWIREGHFQSQEDIARALGVSKSQISRLLNLTRLPAIVLEAFAAPSQLREVWGLNILSALERPGQRDLIIRAARRIVNGNKAISSKQVYRTIITASVQGRHIRHAPHDEVINSRYGSPLFRIRHKTTTVALELKLDTVSARTLERVKTALVAILDNNPENGDSG
jgi:ParB family chromosome partitioning protein